MENIASHRSASQAEQTDQEISLATAIDRIEASLLENNSIHGGEEENPVGLVKIDEYGRYWVTGSFSVAEPDPYAPLVNGRMLTEIKYDASVVRHPRLASGLVMSLCRQTEPGTMLQFDFYDDGRVYAPANRGLHPSWQEGQRGEPLNNEAVESLRKQLATAAGFDRPQL